MTAPWWGTSTASALALAELTCTPLVREGEPVDWVNMREPAIADLVVLLVICKHTGSTHDSARGAHWNAPGYLTALEIGLLQLASAGLPFALDVRELGAVRARALFSEQGWN